MFDEDGEFVLLVGDGTDEQTLKDLLDLAREEIENGYQGQTTGPEEIQ